MLYAALMMALLVTIVASCITVAAGATLSGGSARSKVVAGPQLSVEVFKPMMRSTDGTVCQCLRLPAVVLDRASGWHLAFAECRHDVGDGCLPSGVKSTTGGTDVALRVSRTQGRSWGPMTIVAKQAGHPTPTYDSVRNVVVLQFNQFEEKACTSGRHGNCTAFSYNNTGPGEPLLDLRGCCPNFQIQSSTGGVSWGPWEAVEPTNAVAWPARVGSGTGIQLRRSNPHKPGRLLNVGWHLVQPPGPSWVSTIRNSFDAIFFSDSGGKTWQQPKQPRQLNASCNEAQLAEMPNGDVLAIMRQSSPVNGKAVFEDCSDCRVLSISSDGGDTWGWGGQLGAVHPERQLAGATCLAGLLGDTKSVYASYPNSSTRARGVVRVSTDNARTWSDHVSFGDSHVPFAYSSMTEMHSADTIGILWETGMKGCTGVSCRTLFSVFPKLTSEQSAATKQSVAVVATANLSAARSVPYFGYNTVGTEMAYGDPKLAAATGIMLGHGLLGRYPGGTVSDFWMWQSGWVNTSGAGFGKWKNCGPPLNNTLAAWSSFVYRAGWAREQLFCLNTIQGTAEDQVSMLEAAVVEGSNRSTVGFIELGNELFAGDHTLLEPQTYPTPADYAKTMEGWIKLIRRAKSSALQRAPIALVAAPHNFSTSKNPNPYAQAWNREVFGTAADQGAAALASAATVHVYQSLAATIPKNGPDKDGAGSFQSVFNRISMQRQWAQATIPARLDLWITEYGGEVSVPDHVSGSWMHALYQVLFTMLLPADERVTVLLSHALTWKRLDDAAIVAATSTQPGEWQATMKGRAMAVISDAARRAATVGESKHDMATTVAATACRMLPITFAPNPSLRPDLKHSSQLLGWAFTEPDTGKVVEAVVVNFSADKRPAMNIVGVFGGTPGRLSWTTYDVAAGELLTVGAKLQQRQGTVCHGCKIAVDVHPFSILSISTSSQGDVF